MEYYKKVGLKKLPQVFVNGFPLSENDMEADVFEESIITKIMHLTQEIQMAVYRNQIHDSTDLLDYLMNKEQIMPRLNPRVLTSNRDYLEINQMNQQSQDFVKQIKYIKSDEQFNALTLWLVCDPDTEKGRQLLYDAIDFTESSKIGARLAVLFKRSSQSKGDDIVKKAIAYSLDNMDKKLALSVVKKLLKDKAYYDLKKNNQPIQDLGIVELSNYENINRYDIDALIKKCQEFLVGQTPFKDSDHIGLIANGWILGPFENDEEFIQSDFSLLENFILKTGLKQTKQLIQKWNNEKSIQDLDDKTIMINSILGKHTSTDKRIKVPVFTSGVVHIKPRNENAPFYDMVAILDPLTRNSQKISTILKVLTQTTNINLVIYFNCKDKLSAPPLKNFYRYVLDGDIRFSNEGELIKPSAYFHNMPQTPILTMNVHPPESWMVEAVHSPFDLDNICLKETEADGAFGEFELEHLIIEGHAFDVLSGQSPRGLQFNLGTHSQPDIYDTIVMANLGYFQLKASPGMWLLKLREGRSKEIYDIISHENTDSESKRSPIINIVIDSFESKVIKVKVSKKADKVSESLLDDKDNEKESSIWNSLANSFSGSSGDDSSNKEKNDNVLNIFSVASGHLYERLMRIMMYTVLKNTKAKVKFWFLKNYLSPQFTKFLPYYAKEYNFEFELVQYKWPRWLHQQTEKQRIIWGYKILFLDVLFPLNVEKIIYVDADQIVRADLTELRDMDLKGAPYGYTPFCDSRKEMDGYRFWKSGYWQMHLGHRKYHISALYVVDLKKFRKIAAGDRLRGQYQGLSQDPNSLSNLDQDLPNNMIHQVNIFSLPQEWLYCDTWCSSDTLSKAKTIDLCNNPQTKEPKLKQAVRIVPEWKDYDNQIKTLMQKWLSEKSDSKVKPLVTTRKNGKYNFYLYV
jgi:UDP-glucose:glycoprotein glucosyltransferase